MIENLLTFFTPTDIKLAIGIMALTFSITWVVKFLYKIFVKERASAISIRLAAGFAAYSSCLALWPGTSPIAWYIIGTIAWPASIYIHRVLRAIGKVPIIKERFPWVEVFVRAGK